VKTRPTVDQLKVAINQQAQELQRLAQASREGEARLLKLQGALELESGAMTADGPDEAPAPKKGSDHAGAGDTSAGPAEPVLKAVPDAPAQG